MPPSSAPRLIPTSRRAGAALAAPVPSGPSVPRSIHQQPPPSDAGSITDNDVTPTPSVAGTPAGSAIDISQVPIAFVLRRLHQMAGQFWSNPRSSDIRLSECD
jgi:hypothetical protein